MKKRFFAVFAALLLLSGCSVFKKEQKQYTATFLDVFDTVTTVTGRAESEESFRAAAQEIHDNLLEYHCLFDIYNTYEGITNLKNINDAAGADPLKVDERIIRLLLDCRMFYDITGGKVNVAMGSVLHLWHEARTAGLDNPSDARLPEWEALQAASKHTNPDSVIIDKAASTVCLTDPHMRLDVGAVAKGWAVQQVAQSAPDGFLISVGGNVCATGPKDPSGTPWVVAIQNTDGSNNHLHTINLTEGCAVTSGDYQRAYEVDGKSYHHIIDPKTLHPSELWSAVTIVCNDSGAADALSTALFLLSQSEGQLLLDQYHAEAIWIAPNGDRYYSPGFRALIRS